MSAREVPSLRTLGMGKLMLTLHPQRMIHSGNPQRIVPMQFYQTLFFSIIIQNFMEIMRRQSLDTSN
jgi:hypothetical protein